MSNYYSARIKTRREIIRCARDGTIGEWYFDSEILREHKVNYIMITIAS
jgi:hypothetical protein